MREILADAVEVCPTWTVSSPAFQPHRSVCIAEPPRQEQIRLFVLEHHRDRPYFILSGPHC